jgi:hypothetical protein
VIELEGNRYACVAMLPEFLGVVNVGPSGIRSLSYSPTGNSPFYVEEGDELLRIRAMAEAVVRTGRLDLITSEAAPFAEAARRLKHQDPVLGVLAAYAYHQAGDTNSIESMIGYFRRSNGFVPFDLAMLVGANLWSDPQVFPGFPMLTDGWRYLGDDHRLHPALSAARLSLAPSLWSTVNGASGAELAAAVERGEIR